MPRTISTTRGLFVSLEEYFETVLRVILVFRVMLGTQLANKLRVRCSRGCLEFRVHLDKRWRRTEKQQRRSKQGPPIPFGSAQFDIRTIGSKSNVAEGPMYYPVRPVVQAVSFSLVTRSPTAKQRSARAKKKKKKKKKKRKQS
jgi:hypothetical protein